MLAARITLPHLSASSAMNFPNAADVIDIGLTPKPASRASMRGSAGNRVDLLVELVDHLSGGLFRRTDPIPLARLVARHEVGQGRNIRQHIRTGRSCHRQRAQHAAPDVLDARGYG